MLGLLQKKRPVVNEAKTSVAQMSWSHWDVLPGYFLCVDEQWSVQYVSREMKRLLQDTGLGQNLEGHRLTATGVSPSSASVAQEYEVAKGVWQLPDRKLAFECLPLELASGKATRIARFQIVSERTPEPVSTLSIDWAFAVLDAIPVNVMFADEDRVLRFMNRRSKETLKQIESLLPVKVDELIGINIDRMHKDPRRVAGILQGLKTNGPHPAVISVGAERLALTASPVMSRDGQLKGFVATWSIVTQQERLEQEARALTQAVASSSTEISAAISEIAESVERSAMLTRDVASRCETSEQEIEQLRSSGAKIAQIIEVITDLSDQTNLLSLNATIEAARAGELGRGFAIVASEVKDLARQTKLAIEDVERTVHAISSVIETVASGSTEIRDAVGRVSHSTTTIAASIEEQSITIRELSRMAERVAVETTTTPR